MPDLIVIVLQHVQYRGLLSEDVPEHVAFDQVALIRLGVLVVLEVEDAHRAGFDEFARGPEGEVAIGADDPVWYWVHVLCGGQEADVEGDVVSEGEVAFRVVQGYQCTIVGPIEHIINLIVLDHDIADLGDVYLQNDGVVVDVVH